MTRYYTGIGSRRTPTDVLQIFFAIAEYMVRRGFTLRSGHADGADLAFERGAVQGVANIFLPWPSFNQQHPVLSKQHAHYTDPNNYALREWPKYHPAPQACSQAAAKLHARNLHQVVGYSYPAQLSEFVVCWTPDGAETDTECSRATGGSGTVIRVATRFLVPVYNLGKPGRKDALRTFLLSLKEQQPAAA